VSEGILGTEATHQRRHEPYHCEHTCQHGQYPDALQRSCVQDWPPLSDGIRSHDLPCGPKISQQQGRGSMSTNVQPEPCGERGGGGGGRCERWHYTLGCSDS